MDRKSKTKRGILVAIIIICMIALIGGTYSRYTSTGTVNATADLAKWSIKLDGTDISTASTTKDVQLVYDDNDYVAEGKLAPGRTAYFNVEVDPSGSEVAIDYTFNVDTSVVADALETGSTSRISISSVEYKVGSGNFQTASDIDNDGTFTIAQNLTSVTNNDKVLVKVTIAWDNDNDGQNISDTAEGVASHALANGKTITIPVSVTAKQHI